MSTELSFQRYLFSKPIYVMGSERCIWKLPYFYKSLREWGMIWPITGSEDVSKLLSVLFLCGQKKKV